MNSPIHHAKDLDPVLRYAPPRVRQQGQPTSDELTSPSDKRWQRDDGSDPDFSGDREIVAMQRRLALEPEWIPEPPQSSAGDGRDLWKIILRAGAVLVFAAVTAWIAVSIPGAKRFGTEVVRASFPQASTGTNLTGTSLKGPSQSSTVPETPADQAERDQPKPQVGIVATAAQEPTSRRDPAEQAPSTAPAAASISQPAPVQAPVPAPVMTTREPSPAPQRPTLDFVTRQLDPAELASMLQRADDFIKSGDLSSARLLLRRAAEAGDVRAALALAGTFDPNVLKTLGFQEAAADIAKARLWYERAEKFGSAEAQQRLQLLATTIHPER
jgi:hypothetical protein